MGDARNIFPLEQYSPNLGLFVKLNCTRIIDVRARRRTSQIQYWKRIPFRMIVPMSIKVKVLDGIDRASAYEPAESALRSRSLPQVQVTHRQMADRHHPGRKAEPTRTFNIYPAHVGACLSSVRRAICPQPALRFQPLNPSYIRLAYYQVSCTNYSANVTSLTGDPHFYHP